MRFVSLPASARQFAEQLAAAFAPPPDILPSVWAEQNLVLTSDFAAEPGNYDLSRTPWCRQPLDDAADPTVEMVSIGGASQLGKTQLSLAVAAYYAVLNPCSIMHVVPTDSLAETFSARFDSMILASKVLKDTFVEPRRTRAIANKSVKTFRGGVLVLASSNSPSDLSSRPVRVAIADEVDRMSVVRKEGDPLALISARQQTFPSRKLYQISTPTEVATSRIEAALGNSTYHEWHLRCPHCSEYHHPVWENVNWEPNKPETAVYTMSCCGAVLNDAERWRAGAEGKWIVAHEGKPSHRGYRFNGLVSPWVRLEEIAAQFDAARGSHSKLQPIFNLKLGISYEADIGEGADAETVRLLADEWKPNLLPDKRIVLITCGVDVQQGWLACQIVGWSEGDEAWTLGWHEIEGDPLDPRTWLKLEDVLLTPWRHPSGEMLPVEAVAIDSGFHGDVVLDFTTKNRARGRRWYAIRGMSGKRPIWTRGQDVHRSMSRLHIVGIDAAKLQISSSLITVNDGPGRWHTPTHIHEQAPHFADWFCAEELVTREVQSGVRQEWRLKKGVKRNEALDTGVYALAAKYSSDFGIARRLERILTGGTMKSQQPTMRELALRASSNRTQGNV